MALTAIIKNKIGPTSEWEEVSGKLETTQKTRILKRGEIAIEITSEDNGDSFMLMKVGDGQRTYKELPYINRYDKILEEITKFDKRLTESLVEATTEKAGLMSISDKKKLDSLKQVYIDKDFSAYSLNGIANKIVTNKFTEVDRDVASKVDKTTSINGYTLDNDVNLKLGDIYNDDGKTLFNLENNNDKVLNVSKTYTDTEITNAKASLSGDISNLKDYTDNLVSDTKTIIDNNMNSFKTDINGSFTKFKDDTNDDISSFKTSVNEALAASGNQTADTINSTKESITKECKEYTDGCVKTLYGILDGEELDTTLDSIKEIQNFIKNNSSSIEALGNSTNSKLNEISTKIDNTKTSIESDYNLKFDSVNSKIDSEISSTKTELNSSIQSTNNSLNSLKESHDKLSEDVKTKIPELINDSISNISGEYLHTFVSYVGNDTDWNSLTDSGFYVVNTMTGSNSPSTTESSGILLLDSMNNANVIQVFIPNNYKKAPLWYRFSSGKDDNGNFTYGNWQHLSGKENFITDISYDLTNNRITFTKNEIANELNLKSYDSLKNPNSLKISVNGVESTYDGSTEVQVSINPTSVGAAPVSHDHFNYFDRLTGGEVYNSVLFKNNTEYTDATSKLGCIWDNSSIYESSNILSIENNSKINLSINDATSGKKTISVTKDLLTVPMNISGTITNATNSVNSSILSINTESSNTSYNGIINYSLSNTSVTTGSDKAIPIDGRSAYHVLKMRQNSNSYIDVAFPQSITALPAFRYVNDGTKNTSDWNYLVTSKSIGIENGQLKIFDILGSGYYTAKAIDIIPKAATSVTIGGIRVGNGLNIDNGGTLSVDTTRIEELEARVKTLEETLVTLETIIDAILHSETHTTN